MKDLSKITQYRKKVDQAHKQVVIAEGSLTRAMDELEQKHGCSTISEGKTVLRKLQNKAKRLRKKANDKLSTFEEKWRDKL